MGGTSSSQMKAVEAGSVKGGGGGGGAVSPEQEAAALAQAHSLFARPGGSTALTYSEFLEAFGLWDDGFVQRMFARFDSAQNDRVGFPDFLLGLSRFGGRRGRAAQVSFIFGLFEADGAAAKSDVAHAVEVWWESAPDRLGLSDANYERLGTQVDEVMAFLTDPGGGAYVMRAEFGALVRQCPLVFVDAFRLFKVMVPFGGAAVRVMATLTREGSTKGLMSEVDEERLPRLWKKQLKAGRGGGGGRGSRGGGFLLLWCGMGRGSAGGGGAKPPPLDPSLLDKCRRSVQAHVAEGAGRPVDVMARHHARRTSGGHPNREPPNQPKPRFPVRTGVTPHALDPHVEEPRVWDVEAEGSWDAGGGGFGGVGGVGFSSSSVSVHEVIVEGDEEGEEAEGCDLDDHVDWSPAAAPGRARAVTPKGNLASLVDHGQVQAEPARHALGKGDRKVSMLGRADFIINSTGHGKGGGGAKKGRGGTGGGGGAPRKRSMAEQLLGEDFSAAKGGRPTPVEGGGFTLSNDANNNGRGGVGTYSDMSAREVLDYKSPLYKQDKGKTGKKGFSSAMAELGQAPRKVGDGRASGSGAMSISAAR